MDFNKITERKETNSYKWSKYSEEVLPMWVADMDFEVAKPIQEAVQQTQNQAIYGYGAIPDMLYDVIINRLQSKHNWQIKKEWVVCLPGMVPALFAVNRLFEDKSVGVIINNPVYHHFHHAADQQIKLELPFLRINDEWEIDFEAFTLLAKKAKIFMLCNPHNPNGKMFTEAELLKIGQICVDNEVIICSDEIHCDLILNAAKKHVSIGSLDQKIADNSITLLSPSKTFNIAGLGFTFAIIPNDALRKRFEKVIFGILPMVSNFSTAAAIAAYTSCEDWHIAMTEYLRNNHQILINEINSIDGLSMHALDATYLAWINYEKLGNINFTEILEKHGLGVQDASIFGGKSYFRMNFATQQSRLLQGIKIIREARNSLL